MKALITERVEAGRQILCLNRVDKKNALNLEMYAMLSELLSRAETDESVRATLIYGAGDVFSSGNDLSELAQPLHDMQPALSFLNILSHYKKPLIAAVEGAAVGIGATMLLHCDFIICSRTARFQLPFVPLGLVPEAASTYFIPRLIGHQKAFEVLVLGESFNANIAYDMRMVNHLCEEGEAYNLALLYADKIAALPSYSVQMTKHLLKEGVRSSLNTFLKNESAIFQNCLRSNDTQEALKAFLSGAK